jgi:hypothetical protein
LFAANFRKLGSIEVNFYIVVAAAVQAVIMTSSRLLCNLEACSKLAISGKWCIPAVSKNDYDLKGKVVAIGAGKISQKCLF